MINLEYDIVIHPKSIFCPIFVDNGRRKTGNNVLFNLLNNCHLNIKLTVELNLSKFLDTKRTN